MPSCALSASRLPPSHPADMRPPPETSPKSISLAQNESVEVNGKAISPLAESNARSEPSVSYCAECVYVAPGFGGSPHTIARVMEIFPVPRNAKGQLDPASQEVRIAAYYR